MAQTSTIEWTDATWNPVTGCSKVSPGCAHCYAETLTARFAGRKGYIEEHRPWTPENAEHNIRLHPERLEQPLRWRKPRMVFVNSMSDLFHELVPYFFLERVVHTMRATPQHTFQVLTKRPEIAARRLERYYRRHGGPPLSNVWLGVSIENARYTWRADVLREIPAAVRFISAEPLLGSLFSVGADYEERRSTRRALHRDKVSNAGRAPLDLTGIDWLIVGGESGGRDARPMHPQWARELRDACGDQCCGQWVQECCGSYLRSGECCGEGVQACCYEPVRGPAFFFKQFGSWTPVVWDDRSDGHEMVPYSGSTPEPHVAMRYAGAGPKSGGRELDGRTWDEMPT